MLYWYACKSHAHLYVYLYKHSSDVSSVTLIGYSPSTYYATISQFHKGNRTSLCERITEDRTLFLLASNFYSRMQSEEIYIKFIETYHATLENVVASVLENTLYSYLEVTKRHICFYRNQM
jgi:hypothetical protein